VSPTEQELEPYVARQAAARRRRRMMFTVQSKAKHFVEQGSLVAVGPDQTFMDARGER